MNKHEVEARTDFPTAINRWRYTSIAKCACGWKQLASCPPEGLINDPTGGMLIVELVNSHLARQG